PVEHTRAGDAEAATTGDLLARPQDMPGADTTSTNGTPEPTSSLTRTAGRDAKHAHSETPSKETDSTLEAPEPGAGLDWPRKIRSLADWETNPLWPGPGRPEDEKKTQRNREKPKHDKTAFGLPQILGNAHPPEKQAFGHP